MSLSIRPREIRIVLLYGQFPSSIGGDFYSNYYRLTLNSPKFAAFPGRGKSDTNRISLLDIIAQERKPTWDY
jgi:hypothetical protein